MLIDTTRQPSARQLRLFAGLFLPGFCIIAGALAYRRGAIALAVILWVAGVAGGAAGLAVPSLGRGIYLTLTWLTRPIGWVLSYAVLIVMYFVVVTPLGWLMRRFHDPMQRGFDRGARSYWAARETPSPDRYFRQF